MKEQHTTKNIKAPNTNWDVLKKHFSHCFDKKGTFDFKKFKQALSKNQDVDFSDESYRIDWLGKSYARLLASDESTTLLKEDEAWNTKQENKTSENLLIKGDNLEVLKHLANAYHEKIKMIYIDPPYNTGSDGFVYQDDRKFSVEELAHLAGIDEDQAQRILEFTQRNSNSHSAWLTFMYPRLYIAKQLLKDDGVIFISIDDNEVAQLRMVMDEVFGEDNFVGVMARKTVTQRAMAKTFNIQHEYGLLYSKNISFTNILGDEKNLFSYKNPDGDPNGSWKSTDPTISGSKNNFRIKNPYTGLVDSPPKGRGWRFKEEQIEMLVKSGKIVFKKDYNKNERGFFFKTYKKDLKSENHLINSLDICTNNYLNQVSTKEMLNYFEERVFDYAKPVSFLKKIISYLPANSNDIILDFFAGSGTTGDAVMQLNAEDGGKRQYILVQLPEKIDPKKNKTAYDFVQKELNIATPTIFDITKERLLRAGKKIREDNKQSKEPKDLSALDVGCKIFETIPNDKGSWEQYRLKEDSFAPQIKLFDESTLNKEDLQTLLTTWKTYDGISLTQNLQTIDLEGYQGHYFDNKLYLIDRGFATTHLKKLLEAIDQNKDFNPATLIVFGYNFQSKILREMADNVKNYANKKHITIDFIIRY